MNFPLQQLINKAVRNKEEKEIKSWHPSKLGSCLRGTYLERLGVEPDTDFDDRTLRVFSVGKLFEEWVVDLLLEQTKEGEFEVETQTRIENEEFGATGYADLVIRTKEEAKVYEIKSKHSKAFWWMAKEGKPQRQHEQQLWCYLETLKIPTGNLLYVSKDDLTIAEYVVLRSNKELGEEVREQFALLNEAWEKKDMTGLPLVDDKDWRAKYCRWHSKCKAE